MTVTTYHAREFDFTKAQFGVLFILDGEAQLKAQGKLEPLAEAVPVIIGKNDIITRRGLYISIGTPKAKNPEEIKDKIIIQVFNETDADRVYNAVMAAKDRQDFEKKADINTEFRARAEAYVERRGTLAMERKSRRPVRPHAIK